MERTSASTGWFVVLWAMLFSLFANPALLRPGQWASPFPLIIIPVALLLGVPLFLGLRHNSRVAKVLLVLFTVLSALFAFYVWVITSINI